MSVVGIDDDPAAVERTGSPAIIGAVEGQARVRRLNDSPLSAEAHNV